MRRKLPRGDLLKEHQAGLGTKELCREHGISDATFHKWRSKYGGMEVSDAKRLKALEAENAKLKKLLAEQMLDVATLKEMLGTVGAPLVRESCQRLRHRSEHRWRRRGLLKPGSRRRAVDWAMKEKSYSPRRACALAGIDPRVYRRQGPSLHGGQRRRDGAHVERHPWLAGRAPG